VLAIALALGSSLLARVYLNERLQRLQQVGVAAALGGVVAIAAA
jgi:EamA domain-containing membrane protein RarD